MPAAQAYIVDALRTPTGRRRGGLAHVHAADSLGRSFIPGTQVPLPAVSPTHPIHGSVERLDPRFDALIAPTCPIVAPTIASLEASDEAFFKANGLLLRNTFAINFLDGCAFSLPCHAPGVSSRAMIGRLNFAAISMMRIALR